MVNLPISSYVKNYYQNHNIVLDDFTQATIIWISHLGWHERVAMIREIAENTADEGLKRQIEDRMNYELQEQALFMENPDGKYLYRVTEYKDGSGHCYFTTVQQAFAYGKENCDDEIRIDKIIVDPEDGSEVEAYCYWDRSGSAIRHFGSYTSNTEPKDTHGKDKRFEMAFVRCEFPFERGDIVRHIVTGQLGVLETSRADWEHMLQREAAGDFPSSALDITVSVDYVGDDGMMYYDHMNVLNLEKTAEFDSKDEKNLMESMSKMLRGEEMFWNYHYYLEQYANFMK